MNVNVQITVAEGDTSSMSTEEAAAAIASALNLDPQKDYLVVQTTVPPVVVTLPDPSD